MVKYLNDELTCEHWKRCCLGRPYKSVSGRAEQPIGQCTITEEMNILLIIRAVYR